MMMTSRRLSSILLQCQSHIRPRSHLPHYRSLLWSTRRGIASRSGQNAGFKDTTCLSRTCCSSVERRWKGTTTATTAGFDTSAPIKKTEQDAKSNPASSSNSQKKEQVYRRLPQLQNKTEEFPSSSGGSRGKNVPQLVRMRILQMAWKRVVEPPTLHLLAASATATLGIGMVEGALMCTEWPVYESMEAGRFVMRYACEQVFPSMVWGTQDAHTVWMAMQQSSLPGDPMVMSPSSTTSNLLLLRDLSGNTPESAQLLLQTQQLATARHFVAGFMMMAQVIRAATIVTGSWTAYDQRIQLGREPPLVDTYRHGGLVTRLCGKHSHVSEVSLRTMGAHLWPVLEDPQHVRFLWKQQLPNHKDRPMYWLVRPNNIGSADSWYHFPTRAECFISGLNKDDRLLVLEADATNGNNNDPLALKDESALDLTLDEASQGFRRILDRYADQGWTVQSPISDSSTITPTKKKTKKSRSTRTFRPLRVYLGNSMEKQVTGGGHVYTIRHRIQYAKEVDVLIDSRAPVLQKVLEWCQRVTGAARHSNSDKRILFFQTSSQTYFWNVKHLLEQYGYHVYDPLDFASVAVTDGTDDDTDGSETMDYTSSLTATHGDGGSTSFLEILMKDKIFMKDHWKLAGRAIATNLDGDDDSSAESGPLDDDQVVAQQVASMTNIPRLVHMSTTAETVNAVEALVIAGEVNASSCCALIDRQDGVHALERTLRRETKFVQQPANLYWERETDDELDLMRVNNNDHDNSERDDEKDHDVPQTGDRSVTTGGLQIICSSSIHDGLFRNVRQWARMGYSAAEIQAEFDAQFKDILKQSRHVQSKISQEEHQKPKSQDHLHHPTEGISSETKEGVDDMENSHRFSNSR